MAHATSYHSSNFGILLYAAQGRAFGNVARVEIDFCSGTLLISHLPAFVIT